MLLSKVLKDLIFEGEFTDTEITDIVYDSRLAAPGTLFTALKGAFTDGHDYADSAYIKGCRVFLLERDVSLPNDAVKLFVKDSRAALPVISANFFNHPARELKLIGVTGTKGKTTVTHMIYTCLNACGMKCGVIGTVGAYFDGKTVPTVNTTPESYEINRILRLMADAGCKAAALEVSSIGLKGHRVDGLTFDIAVFTNFSPDHIGGAEHESIEEYAYWKKQLFKISRFALLNADDCFTKELIAETDIPYRTFGMNMPADLSASDPVKIREKGFFGVGFTCTEDETVYAARVACPGDYSIYNALAAIGVCRSLFLGMDVTLKGLEKARVKGRNECVPVDADFDVIIDYAHNGTSFRSVLGTVKEYKHNRIITVFGSVGDRAQLRRSEMGLVSGEMADLSIITSDDPGFEDPGAICGEIASFVKKAGGQYEIIPDRKEAVFRALSIAEEGDMVLLLGKGHETCQKICGEKVLYSDHESVEEFFNTRVNRYEKTTDL